MKSVSIDIGANAILQGGAIYLIAQAEDRPLADALGLTTLEAEFFIDPALGFLNDLTALPIKVLLKGAEAKVTLGAGSQLLAADVVGVYATSAADSTGQANSPAFISLGYAQATATSIIDVATGVLIEAGGAVNLSSDASATASMSAETAPTGQEKPKGAGGADSGGGTVPGADSFGGSIAVSNAIVTSKTTVAAGATIHAGRTLNVRALGAVESSAESSTGLGADGTAALSLALEFSKADILAQVDGTLTADMNTEGGEVVKMEFDPTTTDPTKVGYIDYDRDLIRVFDEENQAKNWVVVTEDTVTYSPRRGNGIGGLDAGGTYYVIEQDDDPSTTDIDESKFIKLAINENDAINNIGIDLQNNLGEEVSLNKRTFAASDIHDDQITFQGVGNTFELGQAVIYHEGTAPIPGLEDGETYDVMAGTDQFNLLGDGRLVDSQTIRLGTLENEVRGGIARVDIGPVPAGGTGYSLSATHILDSDFATFGVLTKLDATDEASADAGLTDQNPTDYTIFELADYGAQKKFGKDIASGSSLFERLFGAITEKYGAKSDSGGAGAGPLRVAGALAFSCTDHDVNTHILGTSDLNSNDDMELRAELIQEIQINAESIVGEAESAPFIGPLPQGATRKNVSDAAPNSVSLAVVIGVQNNTAHSIVESGAELDAMRALRVISAVTYPFLTRPDEFVPTSLSELSDKITSEGVGSFNSYLDGTLGLKSDLLNTWAQATTTADKVGFAGSVNVLVFTNDSQAIIRSGTQVNQDPFYRPDPRFYLKPGDAGYDPDYAPDAEGIHGNDNITHSANANNVDEHVVSVEATNWMQFLNLTGTFKFALPTAGIDPTGIVGVEPFKKPTAGGTGGKGGVGGAIFLQFLDNTTHAIVEPRVALYSGKQSGLNIKAEEALMSFNFTQGGADAGKLAIGGSFSFFEQDSDILAHLAEDSLIEGGRVDVYAGALETQINWAGGVASSEALGVGIAVAINDTNRKTRAVIGKPEDTATKVVGVVDFATNGTDPDTITRTGPSWKDAGFHVGTMFQINGTGPLYQVAAINDVKNSSDVVISSTLVLTPAGDVSALVDGAASLQLVSMIDVDGAVTARASVAGGMYAFTVAGASANTTPDKKSQTTKQQQAGTGVAIAAAASVNLVTDVTQVSLSDAIVNADAVDIKANNQTRLSRPRAAWRSPRPAAAPAAARRRRTTPSRSPARSATMSSTPPPTPSSATPKSRSAACRSTTSWSRQPRCDSR